jgi:hypothetical protein
MTLKPEVCRESCCWTLSWHDRTCLVRGSSARSSNTSTSQRQPCQFAPTTRRRDAFWYLDIQPEGREPYLSRLPQRLPPAARRRLPHPSNIQRPSTVANSHARVDHIQPCQAREHILGCGHEEQRQCRARVRVPVPVRWTWEGVLWEI